MQHVDFWTVFKADMLWFVCTVTLSIVLTIIVTWWRKRKAKHQVMAVPVAAPFAPKAVILDTKNPAVAGHCPLCGRDWPLPGPLIVEGPASMRGTGPCPSGDPGYAGVQGVPGKQGSKEVKNESGGGV
jgi:hypothetical protein